MAENYDPNDPESVRRYIEEQTKVQSKLTADTNRFGKAMNTAFSGAGTAALSFASAVGSAEKGFSKYNSVVRDITNTIGELTSEFGIFGKSVGAAAKATGIMVEQVFAQTDRMSKGFEEIADMGAQAHFTATSLRALTEAAGGSTFQMQAVGKAAKTAGSAFINVGDSVGSGMQKFGDIVTKNMTGFRKLGFTFEEVFEYTGKYLQQANALGVNLNRPVADLRKSSEAYMKNLVILADLTGADIKQQQAALDLAAANENIKMKIMMLEKQASDAKQRGDFDTEARIRKQVDNIQTAIQGISRFDKEAQIAFLQSFASGGKVMNEYTARLQISGLDVLKAGKQLEQGIEGTEIVAGIMNDNAEAVAKTMQRFGTGIAELGPAGIELAKAIGNTNERMTLASEQGVTGQRKNAQAALEAGQQGVEAQMNTRDALMQGVANMEQMERNVQRTIDRVVDRFNPFMTSMDDAEKSFKVLAAAAGAATFAMGILTSAAARRNPLNLSEGFLGRKPLPGTGGIVGPGSAASAPWVRVANLMEICNCVGGGAAMPLGSQGMNKAQQKQYRKMRAQGVSEAQARGRILGAGGVGGGMLPGTGGIVPPGGPQAGPQAGPQGSRFERFKPSVGHAVNVGAYGIMGSLGGYALSEGADLAKDLGVVEDRGASGMKAAGGVISSAAQYAMMGSLFGPIGTGIGAVAGGLMGVVENFDDIKNFFSSSNETAEKAKDATEAATIAAETLAEQRTRNEDFLKLAIIANTEATRQNTTVTTQSGAAPGAGDQPREAPREPSKTVEQIEKGFDERQVEMAKEYASKRQKLWDAWNTNDEAELKRLEKQAKEMRDRFTKERDVVVGYSEFGPIMAKEKVIEDKAAKEALAELEGKIASTNKLRTARTQALNALEKEYVKNRDDLEEQRRKLQITRENAAAFSQVTDERLQILADLVSGKAQITGVDGAGPRGATPSSPGGGTPMTAQDLAKGGLKVREHGDVQRPGAVVDQKLLDLSKEIQNKIPGFRYFSGFNDQFHKDNSPGSAHVRGDAVDFTLAQNPSIRQGQNIVDQLKSMGFGYARDEYNNPSSRATGGHIHAELAEGGIVQGPKSGYPVTMHGREIVTPLEPNSILEQLGKTMGNFTNIKNDRSSETDTKSFDRLSNILIQNFANVKNDGQGEIKVEDITGSIFDSFATIKNNRSERNDERAFENLSSALTTNIEKSLGSFTEKFTAPEFSSEMLNQLSLSDKILEKFDTLNQNKEDKTIDIESVNRQIADKVESAMKSLGEQNSQVAGEYILRLERVIDILESSHSTQEKLLRSTRT